jgi:hypothetical protein
MTGYVIVQRRADAAQIANLRLALVKKMHFEKIRIPFVRMFAVASAAGVERVGPVATDSESVGRQSDLRVTRSGKPRLKVASNA